MKDKPSLLLTFVNGFRKYSVTIFLVVLVGGLVTAVLMLNTILQQSSNPDGYTSSLDNTTFDQVTIDKVNKLHTSAEATGASTLPGGRINPFAE
jgi:hypothetical protein